MYFYFIFYFFLNIYFLEDQIGNNCTIVWFNVSVSSVNIIYICVFRYLLMHYIQTL